VRWFTETGHGNDVWREPAYPLPVIGGTRSVEYSLPARGMVWRSASRQFRIGFRNAGTITGGVVDQTIVQVTVLPVYGAKSPTYPYQHLAQPGAAIQQVFPMTAREWRLRDSTGLPIAVGAISITFVGALGALFGPVDASLLSEYTSLPHDAAAWLTDSLVYADYR